MGGSGIIHLHGLEWSSRSVAILKGVQIHFMKTISSLGLVLSVCCVVQAQNLETPAPRPNPPLPYSATVDPAIPAYKPVKGLSGTLKGVESNTVTVVQQKWIDGFTKIYPNVKISVDIGGSGQGGPRLTNGSADFAFIAREMMGREEFPVRRQVWLQAAGDLGLGRQLRGKGVHGLRRLHREQGQPTD